MVKDAHVMKELEGIINSPTNRRVNQYTTYVTNWFDAIISGIDVQDMRFALHTIIHTEFRTSSLLHLSDLVLIDNKVIYK